MAGVSLPRMIMAIVQERSAFAGTDLYGTEIGVGREGFCDMGSMKGSFSIKRKSGESAIMSMSGRGVSRCNLMCCLHKRSTCCSRVPIQRGIRLFKRVRV